MAPLEVCNVYLDLQQSVPADMHYCYTDNKMWGQGLPDLKWMKNEWNMILQNGKKCYLLHDTAEIEKPFALLILLLVPKINSVSFCREL